MPNKRYKYDPLLFLKAAIAVGSHHMASEELQEEARALRIRLGIRKDRLEPAHYTCIALHAARGKMSFDDLCEHQELYRKVTLYQKNVPSSYWNKPATPENQQYRYNMMLLMAEIARTGL